jgi:acyl carrier protein
MRQMARDNLVRRLAAILGDVTGAPADDLEGASSQDNTPGWDSVSNLAFLAAVEDEFGVSILTREAMGLRTLTDFAGLLEAKGKTE